MTTNESVIDPSTASSVYFVHPSDNTTVKLISHVFDGKGYADWKRSMMIALSAKNKLSFVDGSLPKPEVTDPKHKHWKR